MHELVHLPFEHLGDRDARPLGDDAGYVLFIDLLLEHLLSFLEGGELVVPLLQFLLQGGYGAVSDLRDPSKISPALQVVGLRPRLVDLLLCFGDARDKGLLLLPVPAFFLHVLFQLGEFILELLPALPRRLVLFLLQRLDLDLGLDDLPFDLIDLGGNAVYLHAQPR